MATRANPKDGVDVVALDPDLLDGHVGVDGRAVGGRQASEPDEAAGEEERDRERGRHDDADVDAVAHVGMVVAVVGQPAVDGHAQVHAGGHEAAGPQAQRRRGLEASRRAGTRSATGWRR
jgi:hypothetical protein